MNACFGTYVSLIHTYKCKISLEFSYPFRVLSKIFKEKGLLVASNMIEYSLSDTSFEVPNFFSFNFTQRT
jgi:hypothetical protein